MVLLDIALDFTIGTCRLATSGYLPYLAEATMYARGAGVARIIFGDIGAKNRQIVYW